MGRSSVPLSACIGRLGDRASMQHCLDADFLCSQRAGLLRPNQLLAFTRKGARRARISYVILRIAEKGESAKVVSPLHVSSSKEKIKTRFFETSHQKIRRR